jgi:hypothetical protein
MRVLQLAKGLGGFLRCPPCQSVAPSWCRGGRRVDSLPASSGSLRAPSQAMQLKNSQRTSESSRSAPGTCMATRGCHSAASGSSDPPSRPGRSRSSAVWPGSIAALARTARVWTRAVRASGQVWPREGVPNGQGRACNLSLGEL